MLWLLAVPAGAVAFDVNQAEECAQNDQGNKRVQDRPGILRKNIDERTVVDVGSVTNGEVSDRPSHAERAEELPGGIMQGARDKQNRPGGKRRREQSSNDNSGEAVCFEMLIQLFRSVLSDSPFERFLFALFRQSIGKISAGNGSESSQEGVVGPIFRALHDQDDEKYVDAARQRHDRRFDNAEEEQTGATQAKQ